MMNQFKDAIEILKTADPLMDYADIDPVYNNNLTKWLRFADKIQVFIK